MQEMDLYVSDDKTLEETKDYIPTEFMVGLSDFTIIADDEETYRKLKRSVETLAIYDEMPRIYMEYLKGNVIVGKSQIDDIKSEMSTTLESLKDNVVTEVQRTVASQALQVQQQQPNSNELLLAVIKEMREVKQAVSKVELDRMNSSNPSNYNLNDGINNLPSGDVLIEADAKVAELKGMEKVVNTTKEIFGMNKKPKKLGTVEFSSGNNSRRRR